MKTRTQELRELLRSQRNINDHIELMRQELTELGHNTKVAGKTMSECSRDVDKLAYYGSAQKAKTDFFIEALKGSDLTENLEKIGEMTEATNNLSKMIKMNIMIRNEHFMWVALEDYINNEYSDEDFKKIKAEDCKKILRDKKLI